jgi:hypothetical protein
MRETAICEEQDELVHAKDSDIVPVQAGVNAIRGPQGFEIVTVGCAGWVQSVPWGFVGIAPPPL